MVVYNCDMDYIEQVERGAERAGPHVQAISRRRACHSAAPSSPPLVDVSTGMERECQQNGSPAHGCTHRPALGVRGVLVLVGPRCTDKPTPQSPTSAKTSNRCGATWRSDSINTIMGRVVGS